MADNNVTLSHEQVREIFKALRGIGNLVKNIVAKPGNPTDAYAIMSNIAVIQATLAGMPRVSSN